MNWFKQAKPRGFEHRYLFYNGRKEYINQLKEKYKVESSMNKGENKEASKRIVKPILLRSKSYAFTPLTQSFLLVIPMLLFLALLAVVYYWLI
ncbi:MAG: hypothetical protein ACTTHI_00940 [Prevotella sp.]